jgi:hypothetical protein
MAGIVEDLHVVARHRDGRRADLDRQLPRPSGLPAMAQPVSVCHQWSMTGTLSLSCAHLIVSGSARSPARNSERRPDRSYLPMNSPSGSSFLMARKAVGAVNSDDLVLLDHPPEGAGVGRADGLALEHDGRAAVQQRP